MRYSPKRKLSPSQVERIRQLRREGFKRAWLARHFKISKHALQLLLSGATYKDIK